MNDAIAKIINGLSIENILYLALGLAGGTIGTVVVYQLPDILNALLKRTKRIENNQNLLIENDKIIVYLIVELARSLKVSLTVPQIRTIEKQSDEDF